MVKLLDLPPEVISNVVSCVHRDSLLDVRLSCRTLYRVSLEVRWDAICFKQTQGNLSKILKPLSTRLNAGHGLPLALKYTKSARFIVDYKPKSRSSTLVGHLITVLLALASVCPRFKHLHISLKGLYQAQRDEVAERLRKVKVELYSLRTCPESWTDIFSMCSPEYLRSLYLRNSDCLADAVHQFSKLEELHMHGIDTENFAGATARIRERFPHLRRLSLNGHHWNSVFSGLLLPAKLQESLFLSTHDVGYDDGIENLNHLRDLSELVIEFALYPRAQFIHMMRVDYFDKIHLEGASYFLDRLPAVKVVVAQPGIDSFHYNYEGTRGEDGLVILQKILKKETPSSWLNASPSSIPFSNAIV